MKIDHIAVWVEDLEKMKDFYSFYFGAKPGALYVNEKKKFKSYFLSFEGKARLELMTKPGLMKEDSAHTGMKAGLAHFSISVGNKENVDLLTDKLRQDGYSIIGEPRTTGDGYYESVVLDPEGNPIEITV
jgi:lactoylglutathione lyase